MGRWTDGSSPSFAGDPRPGGRMLPYADLPYFTLLVIVTLPAVLLGLAERSRRPWILAASGLMAVVHFGLSSSSGPGLAVRDLWIAAGFALGQLLLALGF